VDPPDARDGRLLLLNSTSGGAGPGVSAYLRRDGGDPIHCLDPEKVELWKKASPPDLTGMVFCGGILPSADGRSYV
jgi:hypothetical protein